jgi:hypothetical protein
LELLGSLFEILGEERKSAQTGDVLSGVEAVVMGAKRCALEVSFKAPNPICRLNVIAGLAAADEAAPGRTKGWVFTKQRDAMPKIDKAVRIQRAEGRHKRTAIGDVVSADTASIEAAIKPGPGESWDARHRRWRRLLGLRESRGRDKRRCGSNGNSNFFYDTGHKTLLKLEEINIIKSNGCLWPPCNIEYKQIMFTVI